MAPLRSSGPPVTKETVLLDVLAREDGMLTARQREVLRHVVDRGYYEIPRSTTLRPLAKELGISTTSLSLILRRAEAKIVSSFVERLDTA